MNRIAYHILGVLSLAAATTVSVYGQSAPATQPPAATPMCCMGQMASGSQPAARPQTMSCMMAGQKSDGKSGDMAGMDMGAPAKPQAAAGKDAAAAQPEKMCCPMSHTGAASQPPAQSLGMAGTDAKVADGSKPPCCCDGKMTM